MTKETGIIMSGDHPKLTLDRLKTMTRRTYGLEEINKNPNRWVSVEHLKDNLWEATGIQGVCSVVKCPYGQVGDQLWVRETWWQGNSPTYGKHCIVYAADEQIRWHAGSGFDNPDLARDFIKKPSIHMFKRDSRIWLEITSLRAERVQEITLADMQREGLRTQISTLDFSLLWNSLNAKRGYGWDFDPWVWPIGYKLLELSDARR